MGQDGRRGENYGLCDEASGTWDRKSFSSEKSVITLVTHGEVNRGSQKRIDNHKEQRRTGSSCPLEGKRSFMSTIKRLFCFWLWFAYIAVSWHNFAGTWRDSEVIDDLRHTCNGRMKGGLWRCRNSEFFCRVQCSPITVPFTVSNV